jgi:outer membrane receptor protein involved in Fe transport
MKGYSRLHLLLAIVTFASSAHLTFAQGASANAQLNGTITDPSGRTVVGAAIRVLNTATGTLYSATSNESGYYVVANVPPGAYELKASFTGFANYTQTGIVLTVGQVATINVSLRVASQGEVVVVTSEAPVIEPTRSEISQVVVTQQIQSLPISNRVFTDFALLTPGVATSRTSLGTTITEFEVTQISFGGMRSFSNTILVDGADFVNTTTGVQRSTPPQESVQEFRVVNNGFGAEYGRAAGGIVNIVTKSGTNDLHGSAYEYFQNNATNARSLLQPAPLPDQLRQNQFGGTLGGPIVKDKTFFWLNYESKRRAESPLYPPDLINNLSVIDESKALMGLAPEGCNTGLSNCTGSNISYLNSYLKTTNDDWGFARLDHQFGPNEHLALHYNIEDTRATGELVGNTLDGGGIGTPSGGRNLLVRDQAVVANLSSLITPNIVNTFIGQFARRHYNFLGQTGQPDFSVLNDLELGHNFGIEDRVYETRAEFGDSISWVKRNHVWKFGFDGNYLKSLLNFPGFTPVRLLMPGGVPCLANFATFYNSTLAAPAAVPADVGASAAQCAVAADNGVVFMYAGVPLPTSPTACTDTAPCTPLVTSASNPLNTATWSDAYPKSLFNGYSREIPHGYWGFYAQDQWRITPKLTLNYGVRWDYESGLSSYVKPDYMGWQPRVGLAYSPDSKTVIRAGFGMFDDRYNLSFFFIPNTQKIVPGYLCDNNPSSATAATCAASGVLPQKLPMIQKGNGQATQGYQLLAFPASQGAAAKAASVIATGGYDAFTNNGTATGTITMAGTCFTTGACGVGSGGMDYNVSKIPYSEQASLEIDRQLPAGLAIRVGYLFVEAHRLVRGNNINVPCPLGTTDANQAAHPTDPAMLFGVVPEWTPGKLNADGSFSGCLTGTPTLGTGALAGLGPWFGGVGQSGLQTLSAGLIDFNNGVANANYHGATVTVLEKLKNLSLTANYTYSHTIDNGNFTTFISLPVNQFDYNAERANSNQDLRHRFVANFTATGPERTFLRHFTLSSIITLQSGRPFTLYYGGNTLGDVAGGATDRVGGMAVNPHCPNPTDCATMIARNTYFGDKMYSWDLHLGRYFQLSERLKLDLSADAFNLLNRQNVDEITSVYGSPVFCGTTPTIPRHYRDAASLAIEAQAPSTACPAGPIPVPGGTLAPTPAGAQAAFLFIPSRPNANFGLPRTMLNPRQFQFTAKFSF